MTGYRYRPVRFYLTAFALTWAFWIPAAVIGEEGLAALLMFLGLCAPAAVALVMVLTSGSAMLRADLKRKLFRFYSIRPWNLLAAIALFAGIVGVSVLLGQPVGQFAFTDGFSFSVGGASALLTILLASVIEEVGWRGYGEDSIAQYCSWFRESILFGVIWALWHLPLFFIDGSYQAGLLSLGPGYALNFFISVVPLGFLTTWVYVRNDRSMLACILFHLFVNFFQEKIAMTPQTKCVETIVVTAAAAVIVWRNQELFFGRGHIGRLPNEKCLFK